MQLPACLPLTRTSMLSQAGRVAAAALLALAAGARGEAVVDLTDDAFDDFIKTEKHTMVEFFAPWCGCRPLSTRRMARAAAATALSCLSGRTQVRPLQVAGPGVRGGGGQAGGARDQDREDGRDGPDGEREEV